MPDTILASFAHPDDEAFGVAGTLIQQVRRGDRVILVCATRSEEGEISDPALVWPTLQPGLSRTGLCDE